MQQEQRIRETELEDKYIQLQRRAQTAVDANSSESYGYLNSAEAHPAQEGPATDERPDPISEEPLIAETRIGNGLLEELEAAHQTRVAYTSEPPIQVFSNYLDTNSVRSRDNAS